MSSMEGSSSSFPSVVSSEAAASNNSTNNEVQQRELLSRYDCQNVEHLAFDNGGKVITGSRIGSKVLIQRVLTTKTIETSRLDRDMKVRSGVSDPSILPLIESLKLPNVFWSITEYRSLISVQDFIGEHGPLPDQELKFALNQLFSGIANLFNAGFAPLRICAQTILFDQQAGQVIIEGLGDAVEYDKEKSDDLYAATREKVLKEDMDVYVAPEVWTEVEYNARKAVIWSCGVLLYFMATGETDKLLTLGVLMYGSLSSVQEETPNPAPTSPAPTQRRRSSLFGHFRRTSFSETPTSSSSQSRRLSNASVRSKFILHLNTTSIPNYARWILPKMLHHDPGRRSELIEICSRVPKDYSDKAARPLMEIAWMDYKNHVRPLAGLDLGGVGGNGENSYAGSLYSVTSSMSSPFRGLLGGGSGRRPSEETGPIDGYRQAGGSGRYTGFV